MLLFKHEHDGGSCIKNLEQRCISLGITEELTKKDTKARGKGSEKVRKSKKARKSEGESRRKKKDE